MAAAVVAGAVAAAAAAAVVEVVAVAVVAVVAVAFSGTFEQPRCLDSVVEKGVHFINMSTLSKS